MYSVVFCNDDINFNLAEEETYRNFLVATAKQENVCAVKLSIVHTSIDRIIEINNQFLKHNYETDIITFPYHDPQIKETIEGDLYISIPTVEFNAKEFEVSFREELARVYVHGLLHLIGFDDKRPEDSTIMREKENFYLQKYFS